MQSLFLEILNVFTFGGVVWKARIRSEVFYFFAFNTWPLLTEHTASSLKKIRVKACYSEVSYSKQSATLQVRLWLWLDIWDDTAWAPEGASVVLRYLGGYIWLKTAINIGLVLGIKTCETNQWRKTKNKQDNKEPRNNIERTNNNP